VIRAGARPIEKNAGLALERARLVSIDEGPFSIEASAIHLTASPFETIEGLTRIDGGLFEIDAGLIEIIAGPIEIDDEPIEIDAEPMEIDDESIEIDAGLVEIASTLAASRPFYTLLRRSSAEDALSGGGIPRHDDQSPPASCAVASHKPRPPSSGMERHVSEGGQSLGLLHSCAPVHFGSQLVEEEPLPPEKQQTSPAGQLSVPSQEMEIPLPQLPAATHDECLPASPAPWPTTAQHTWAGAVQVVPIPHAIVPVAPPSVGGSEESPLRPASTGPAPSLPAEAS